MATASSVLATRVFAALRASTVATQAGVASGTWASTATNSSHIFRGLAGWLGGRCRGRLPFIEFDVESQAFNQLSLQGGTMTQAIRLRVHVGGLDPGATAETAAAILCAAFASIRSETVDNLTALGDENIEPAQFGPFGVMRDGVMMVNQSYERDSYEVV